MVVSLRGILSRASVGQPFTGPPWKEAADMLDYIWDVLVWSFAAMFHGKWPTHISLEGGHLDLEWRHGMFCERVRH